MTRLVPRTGGVQRAKRTLAEELRLQLADDIVRGALEPGSSLDESDIARRFNVSRTPVREALRQLVASGLVNSRAHRSAVVARPNAMRDHIETVREEYEVYAVSL
jgi:DNA-binding GntR family transcriptional regulator